MALPATDTLELANRLRPVLLRLNRHLRREAHELGVTGGQAILLHAITENPGAGVRELAELQKVSSPAMSGYLDRLEQAGLVERSRSESDARRLRISVTPSGTRVLRSIRVRRTAWLAERLDRLGPEELEAVEAAIPSLNHLLADDEALAETQDEPAG